MMIYGSGGSRQAGENVAKFDRFVSLRRLRAQIEAFDTLMANGQIERAMALRVEVVATLLRLGMTRQQIRAIVGARGPVPYYLAQRPDDAIEQAQAELATTDQEDGT
jgi:hypothetical protein